MKGVAVRYRLAFPVSTLLLLFTLAACSPSLTDEELMARAEAALAEGDDSTAEVDIKTLLQRNPEDAAARTLYGEIYLWQINPEAAADEFRRALRGAEVPETRLLLAQALVQAGAGEDLLTDVQDGRYASVEDDPAFQAALARAYLSQADAEAGAAILAGVEAEGNDYVDITRAVYALQVDKDVDAAQELLQAVTARSPRSAHAWSLLGLIANTQGDQQGAEEYFGKAADINPYRVTDRLERVNALLRQGKSQAAAEKLARLERLMPNYPEVNFLRGQLLFDEGRYKEAIDSFALVLQARPTHLGSLLLAANANMQAGNPTSAQRQFTDFLSLQPGHLQAGLQLGRLLLEEGNAEQAEEVARATLEANTGSAGALELLAAALAAQGRNRESAELYQRLTELQPESTNALVALGMQQLVAGDAEAAIARLEEAVEREPDNAQARERLIQAQLVLQNLDAAAAAAKAYTEAAPESARAKAILGRVLLGQESFEAAREQFEAALALEPGNREASGGLAALALRNDDMEGAQDVFRQALEANPGDLAAGMALAALLERSGDPDGMRQLLEATMDANPEALAPRLALARIALREERPGEAIALVTPLQESAAKDPRLWQLLTGAYVVAGQLDPAQTSVRKLIDLRPEDPASLALGAEVAARAGRPAEAEEYLFRALAQQEDSVPLRQMLVQALVRQGKLQQAGEQLAFMPDEELQRPAILALRGQLALIDGDPGNAETLLTEAFAADPTNRHLGLLTRARWELGRRDEALAGLSGWLADNPEDAAVLTELARLQLVAGNEEAARTHYARLVELRPNDALALNNLAWLTREVDPDAALGYVERASLLVLDSPQIKDTYAMVELERGNTERALTLIDEALQLAPDAPELRLNRARILIGAGRSTEAKQVLREISAGADEAVKGQAQALLDGLP